MATFTNQATLTYRNTSTQSNVATGELQEVLSAEKSALAGSYMAGDRVAYVISVRNTGTTAMTGLTVTDDLGAYTAGTANVVPLEYVDGSIQYYVNGVRQAQPTVTATTPLTVTGLQIPAGGNALLLYEATVNGFAPLGVGDTVTNNAVITGTGITPLTATGTILAAEQPVLTIAKAITPTVVAENDRVTYTFTLQNTGNTPATATDNLVITDVFDPVLTDLAVSFNGTTMAQGTDYTYNPTTGLFATTAGQLTVPAATYTRDADTGAVTVVPGTATLTVTGTI